MLVVALHCGCALLCCTLLLTETTLPFSLMRYLKAFEDECHPAVVGSKPQPLVQLVDLFVHAGGVESPHKAYQDGTQLKSGRRPLILTGPRTQPSRSLSSPAARSVTQHVQNNLAITLLALSVPNLQSHDGAPTSAEHCCSTRSCRSCLLPTPCLHKRLPCLHTASHILRATPAWRGTKELVRTC